jgi:hypothetical protein
MKKIAVLTAVLVIPLCVACLTIGQSRKRPLARQSTVVLTAAQRKQALLILSVIDKMEQNLRNAWDQGNDTGLPTDADRKYTEDAVDVSLSLGPELESLPDGDYKMSLLLGLLGYSDVGRIRVSAGEENGDDFQKELMGRYGLQDVEPHLRAWSVLQVARVARNKAARQLGVPVRNFDKGISSKPSRRRSPRVTPRDNALNDRRRNLRSIKEVETDQISFLEVPFVINGVIELSSYYNYGYRDTQSSFFAFRLTDRSGRANVYMWRNAASDELRRQILAAGGRLRGSFTIAIRRDKFTQNASDIYAELLDAGPPLK